MRAADAMLGCVIALGMACGGSAPIVSVPSLEQHGGPAQGDYADQDVSIDGVAWTDMDRRQRAKYMADVVAPTMRPLFLAHDKAAYAEGFGCATCHGNNATEVNFAMPNGLKPLDPDHLPSPASEDRRTAAWASFMITQVTPKMAELLGKQPFDETTGSGFGCFGCHAESD